MSDDDDDTQALVDAYEMPETPGGLLAAARVRAGLSIEQVANRSRVPAEALAAIDADDFEALPAMVYLRGFVRLYAREVGIDSAEPIARLDLMLAERDAQEAQAEEVGEAHVRARSVERVRAGAGYSLAIGAVFAILLLTLYSLVPGPLEARESDAQPPQTTVGAEP